MNRGDIIEISDRVFGKYIYILEDCIKKGGITFGKFKISFDDKKGLMLYDNTRIVRIDDIAKVIPKIPEDMMKAAIDRKIIFDLSSRNNIIVPLNLGIGDYAVRKDGDGRIHQIKNIKVHEGLSRSYPEFIFADGDSEIGQDLLVRAFPINTEPFSKVLARTYDNRIWICKFISHKSKYGQGIVCTDNKTYYEFALPDIESNLIGTANDPEYKYFIE